jgi:hypothetical protein
MDKFQELSPFDQQKLLNGPASKPPPGVAPADLDSRPDHNAGPHAVFVICTLVSLAMFSARGYVRWFRMRKFNVTDGMA